MWVLKQFSKEFRQLLLWSCFLDDNLRYSNHTRVVVVSQYSLSFMDFDGIVEVDLHRSYLWSYLLQYVCFQALIDLSLLTQDLLFLSLVYFDA